MEEIYPVFSTTCGEFEITAGQFYGGEENSYAVYKDDRPCDGGIECCHCTDYWVRAVAKCIQYGMQPNAVFPPMTWESERGVYTMFIQDNPSNESWIVVFNGAPVFAEDGSFIFTDAEKCHEAITRHYNSIV